MYSSGGQNLLVEPLRGHHKKSVVSYALPPTVLDLEANRFACFIQVYSSDNHGMGHRGFRCLEAFRLGETCKLDEGRYIDLSQITYPI